MILNITLLGGLGFLQPLLLAQDVDTTVVAILCVQFADYATELDSRGSVGFTPPPTVDTIENKYRYGDYRDIIFQAEGNVLHPDEGWPDSLSFSEKGFFQYGSLSRYIDDNSYGIHAIVPYRNWSDTSGILNTLSPDGSGVIDSSYVNWLTLDKTKAPRFSTPAELGKYAIGIAKNSLSVAWDSLDVLIIHYAGVNTYNYSMASVYTDATDTVSFSISSERVHTIVSGISHFTYPRVVFHEFLHATIAAEDLHHRSIPDPYDCSGVGHFSIMGDNAHLAAYTPEMLDPWHKLSRGWLRYYTPLALQDSLNLILPLDTLNFHLPIIEEKYEGGRPFVLVIPISHEADTGNWKRKGQHYIIVENRRAVGWDRIVAVEEMDTRSATYGDTTGTGGFLIWAAWYDPSFTRCWVYDADGGFETWKYKGQYGAPTDLYGGSAGSGVFSIWSSPGVFDKAQACSGDTLLSYSRNIYMEFPAYSDSSNINPISRLVIDQFVPAEHKFSSTQEDDSSATKFSAQQKIDVHDEITLATYHTNDKTFIMSGNSVEEMRNIVRLDLVIGDSIAEIDNSALIYFSDTTLGKFNASYIWQQNERDGYYVRVRRADTNLVGSSTIGNMKWGPFEQAPHPVITSKEEFAALAFAADSGIFVSTSTDSGRVWSQPALVPGSDDGSSNPCILIDSSIPTGDEVIVAFVDQDERIGLYRSDLSSTVVLSNNSQEKCKNPITSSSGEMLSVVYQFNDFDDDLKFIARIELDLSGTSVPDDYDIYGLQNQETDDVNRDPVILYTDTADAGKTMIYWLFNKGEKLLFSSNYVRTDDWYDGTESTLSTKTTSYPHLLYHEAGNPKFVVSRSGTYRSGVLLPDNEPSLIIMSKEEDLDANPAILNLYTEIGINLTDGPDRLMRAQLSTPAIVQASDTLSFVQYDYQASKAFTTEPIDTLTLTQVFQLTDRDVALFELDISCSQSATDTMIIESYLMDPSSGTCFSSSGEIKIPPFTGDTLITSGLELPNGTPPSDCIITTSMTRGYYAGGTTPELDIERYMFYVDEAPIPKRARQVRKVVSQPGTIQIFPHPVRRELCFTLESESNGTAILYDLLGRQLRVVTARSDGNHVRGQVALSGIGPGMYMLMVRTEDDVQIRKVIVTK